MKKIPNTFLLLAVNISWDPRTVLNISKTIVLGTAVKGIMVPSTVSSPGPKIDLVESSEQI